MFVLFDLIPILILSWMFVLFDLIPKSWPSVRCLYFFNLIQIGILHSEGIDQIWIKRKRKMSSFFRLYRWQGASQHSSIFYLLHTNVPRRTVDGPTMTACLQTVHSTYVILISVGKLKKHLQNSLIGPPIFSCSNSVKNKIKILDSIARPFTSHTRGAAKFFHICLFLLL